MQMFTSIIAEGDWVLGEDLSTRASIIGYVQSINYSSGEIYVFVTESNRESIMHRIRRGLIMDFVTLDEEPFYEEGQILNLIDLALDERDEAWFETLHKQLAFVRK